MSTTAANSDLAEGQKSLILGTAGHVDHGKTSLVKALTGTDTDRLPQEKARGLTIELGFAALDLPGVRYGVVDVPGHEKFIRTMVAGAAGIDVGLLVIAADDGPMPQTREHLDILRFLGVHHLIVALTKIDLTDGAPRSAPHNTLTDDIRDMLEGSGYRNVPILPISSATGQGLDELRDALTEVAQQCEEDPSDLPFRLAVDRVFSVQGRGTVVTGSVFSGTITEEQTVEILPAGRTCKVREVHRHGQQAGAARPGERAALNLPGITRNDVQRGDELAEPGWFLPTSILDAQLECSHHADGISKPFTNVRVHIGTRETQARLVLFGCDQIPAGHGGFGQLQLADPIVAGYDQRFILRPMADNVTIAGGRVIRPNSKRIRRSTPLLIEHLADAASDEAGSRLLACYLFTEFDALTPKQRTVQSGVSLRQLEKNETRLLATGKLTPFPQKSKTWCAAATVDHARDLAQSRLEGHHQDNPNDAGMSADAFKGWLINRFDAATGKALFDDLLKRGDLLAKGAFVCLPGFAPALTDGDAELLDRTLQQFHAAAFVPPAPAQLALEFQIDEKRVRKLITLATAQNKLVVIQRDVYLHHDRFDELRRTVREVISHSGPASTSIIRQALGSNRKTVIPLLEHLDRIGFTVRVGNCRQLKEQNSLAE